VWHGHRSYLDAGIKAFLVNNIDKGPMQKWFVFKTRHVTANFDIREAIYNRFKHGKDAGFEALVLGINGGSIGLKNGFPLLTHINGDFTIDGDVLSFDKVSAMVFGKAPVELSGRLKDKKLALSVDMDHFQTSKFDLSTQLELEGEFMKLLPGQSPVVDIELSTSGTVLNYQPFKELVGKLHIEDNVAQLVSLKLGNEYELSGTWDLDKSREVALAFAVEDADLKEIFMIAGIEGKKDILGAVNGKIESTGMLPALKTSGHFRVGEGKLGTLNYEAINVHISGTGPLLTFVDSYILREEGALRLDGQIDLQKLSAGHKDKSKEAVKLSFGSDSLIWNGWDISKPLESPEFKMKKDLGSGLRVTFMGYLNDEQAWDESDLDEEEVGVEYQVTEDNRLKMKLKKDEEFFGMEHKINF